MKRSIILQLIFIFGMVFYSGVSAEEITLKSGKRISGDIIEKNNDSIKVVTDGVEVTFFTFEIEKIEVSDRAEAASEPAGDNGEMADVENSQAAEGQEAGSRFREMLQKKEYTKIIEEGNKVLKTNPDSVSVNLSVGVAYYMLNEYKESIEYLQKVVSLAPNNVRSYPVLGAAYQSLGDKKRAREAYSRFVELSQETNPLGSLVIKKILEEFPQE